MNYKKYLPKQIYSHSNNNTTTILAAVIAGVAVGAAIGILFAPDSGSQTRTQIADKAKDLAGSIKDKAQAVKETLQTKAGDLKEQAASTVKSTINQATDKAGDTTPTV